MKNNLKECKHEQFEALTRVGRLTDEVSGEVTSYTADIKIKCAQCNTPFEFVGVPVGSSLLKPMTSVDFAELRAPIRPSTGEFGFPESYDLSKPEKTNQTSVN